MDWIKLDTTDLDLDRPMTIWKGPDGREHAGCAFYPMTNADHDYSVLEWMRNVVQYKYPDTYRDFLGMISGAMWQYNVGDFAKGAMCAIGIVDTKSK